MKTLDEIMKMIREECSGCENWSGTDCTLVAPDMGCPHVTPDDVQETGKGDATNE